MSLKFVLIFVCICLCCLQSNAENVIDTSTLLPSCHCLKCQSNITTGVVIDDQCHYIVNKLMDPTVIHNSPFPQEIFSTQLASVVPRKDTLKYLDIVHILTRRLYKRFGTEYIYLDLDSKTELIEKFLRLPSFSHSYMSCPVYDIRNNIIFEDTLCRKSAQIFSTTPENLFSEILNADNQNGLNSFFKRGEDDELDRHIQEAKKHSYKCIKLMYNKISSDEYFKVNSKETYNMMSNVLFKAVNSIKNWFHTKGKFIINYDPTYIKLTKDDYFMHVPTYTSYISSSGCHIVDVKKGKIFQQPDCETAIDVLRQMQKNKLVLSLVKISNCVENM